MFTMHPQALLLPLLRRLLLPLLLPHLLLRLILPHLLLPLRPLLLLPLLLFLSDPQEEWGWGVGASTALFSLANGPAEVVWSLTTTKKKSVSAGLSGSYHTIIFSRCSLRSCYEIVDVQILQY